MVKKEKLSIDNIHRRNVDVESRGNLGQTLLHEVALSGNIQFSRLMIQKYGADVDALNNRKQTPLWLAAEKGHLSMVVSLFQDFHADSKLTDYLNRTALHVAASKGHFLIVRFLVEKCQTHIDAIDYLGRTPLYMASFFGHSNIIKWLIDYGASISVRTRYGSSTILHGVASSSKTNTQSISVLITCGANPLDTNSSGDTPLHAAHSRKIAKTLLEACLERGKAQQNFRYLKDLLLVKNLKNETSYECALRCSKSAVTLESQNRLASMAAYLKSYITPFELLLTSESEKETVYGEVISVSQPFMRNKLHLCIAGELLHILESTPIHLLSRTILNYLTPIDLMNGIYYSCFDSSINSNVHAESQISV
jgi:ankyrin repeat protein